jgi:lactate dehydrogenase-like 2-hydroxyacid dehydrogenase
MASTGRVLITRQIQAQAIELIQSELPDIELHVHPDEHASPTRAELESWLERGLDGLVCVIGDTVDEALLIHDTQRRLRVVSTMSVGYNHIDIEACRKRDIVVGHTPDVLTETTADLAVGLLIATARRFREALQAVERSGGWVSSWSPTWLCGTDVHHKSVGIIGLGRIGVAVARRLHHGFGCRVLYHGSQEKPDIAAELGPASFRSKLDDLLAESDFVIPLCPLTEKTRHLIHAANLRRMKKTAILINVSRGEVIDQDAVCDALERRQLAAFGTDVTVPEPLPTNHRLLSVPGVTVLPHIGSATAETRLAMARICVENLVAGIKGKALPHPVPTHSS